MSERRRGRGPARRILGTGSLGFRVSADIPPQSELQTPVTPDQSSNAHAWDENTNVFGVLQQDTEVLAHRTPRQSWPGELPTTQMSINVTQPIGFSDENLVDTACQLVSPTSESAVSYQPLQGKCFPKFLSNPLRQILETLKTSGMSHVSSPNNAQRLNVSRLFSMLCMRQISPLLSFSPFSMVQTLLNLYLTDASCTKMMLTPNISEFSLIMSGKSQKANLCLKVG